MFCMRHYDVETLTDNPSNNSNNNPNNPSNPKKLSNPNFPKVGAWAGTAAAAVLEGSTTKKEVTTRAELETVLKTGTWKFS